MEAFSFIALILLSLTAYSGGAVAKAGKNASLKPQVIDLVLAILIFACAIYSRMTTDLNKWLLVLIWAGISGVAGFVRAALRKSTKDGIIIQAMKGKNEISVFRRTWTRWTHFSRRMLDFQSRVLLSLVFFLIVSPFAVAVRAFSDPLNLKHRPQGSFWQTKKEGPLDIQQYRRQF